MFWKEAPYVYQGLQYLIKQYSNIVKYYFNLKYLFSILIYFKCNLFLWRKAEFSVSLLYYVNLLLKKHLFLFHNFLCCKGLFHE